MEKDETIEVDGTKEIDATKETLEGTKPQKNYRKHRDEENQENDYDNISKDRNDIHSKG